MSGSKMVSIGWLLLASSALPGCPVVSRGYHAYQGRVLDADTGNAVPGVRVVACLLDRYPGSGQKDCASSAQKKDTQTDADGAFTVEESRRIGIAVPVPHGFPGPFDTNLLFEKEGYQTKELHWWRDRESLSQYPLIVRLKPASAVPSTP